MSVNIMKSRQLQYCCYNTETMQNWYCNLTNTEMLYDNNSEIAVAI